MLHTYSGKNFNISMFILKAFCAFGVVNIHCNSLFKFQVLAVPFIRAAVPCFLLISGYFLVSDQKISFSRVEKQIKKIIKMIFSATLLFLLYVFVALAVQSEPIIKPEWLSLAFWGRWLILGDNVCYAYWYLTAYLIGLLLVRFIGDKPWTYRLIPILMLAAVILSRYSILIFGKELDPGWSRNGLLCAYPCILTGAYIRKNEERIAGTAISKIIICFAVLSILAYLEVLIFHIFGLGYDNDYSLLTFPLAISIFVLELSFERILKSGSLPSFIQKICGGAANIGQKHSTNIYLIHPILIGTITLISDHLLDLHFIINAEGIFLMSILISEFIIRITNGVKGIKI